MIGGAHTRLVRGELEEIRKAAEDVLAFTAELDETGIVALPDADRRTFRALKNALVEIGERVNGLPPDLLARHAAVDWRGWAGLRDVIARREFGPELHRLHPVVLDDLPALLAALGAELDAERPTDGKGSASG